MHEPERGVSGMSDMTTTEDRERDDTQLDEPVATAPTGDADVDSHEAAAAPEAEVAPADVAEGSLLPDEQSERFRSSWEEIQGSFVDRPQEAVEKADALVSDVMQRVTANLTKERERLEGQWAQGDDVSTEDLRVALTRYRTFFDRLLAA